MRNTATSMFAILGIAFIGLPLCANAATCLKIENIKGQAAYSHQGYKMGKDEFSNSLTFCYEDDYGKFDNNEGIFQRFGSNTWIWFNVIDETEVAEVWTFDFANRKALFARTRGAGSLLPSTVGAFVGDITGTEIQ